MPATCIHWSRETEHEVTPSGRACVECEAAGMRWNHLRLCLECGHVGCCDSSPGRHATAHYQSTAHAVMQSFEPRENWAWCYVEQLYLDLPLKAYEPPR